MNPELLAKAYNKVKDVRVKQGRHTFENFDQCATCTALVPLEYRLLEAESLYFPFPLADLFPEQFYPVHLN